MERREQPKNGGEEDIVYCRHIYRGDTRKTARWWKNQINRRARRKARKKLQET